MNVLHLVLAYSALEATVAALSATLALRILLVNRKVGDRALYMIVLGWALIAVSALMPVGILIQRYLFLSSVGRLAPGDIQILARAPLRALVLWSAVRAGGFALLLAPGSAVAGIIPLLPDGVSTAVLGYIALRNRGATRILYVALALGHAIRSYYIWRGLFPFLGEAIVAAALLAILLRGVLGRGP